MTDEPKFPDVVVQLSGRDGNTGAIMARVSDALKEYRRALSPEDDADERKRIDDGITEFRNAVFDCGSYDEVLQLVMRTVEVM